MCVCDIIYIYIYVIIHFTIYDVYRMICVCVCERVFA